MASETPLAHDAPGEGAPGPERRSFLGALLALGASSIGVVLGIPLARLSLSPLLGRGA